MNEKQHILVVDDDDRLRALLSRYLRENGFLVSTAENAASARERIGLFIFDLMVLDVMMPGENGLAFAKKLREQGEKLPILFLSARASPEDRMAGLETGADDYLTKPFEPKELLLRIHAILRRVTPAAASVSTVAFGEYAFDLSTRQLTLNNEPVPLTGAEISLLAALAENAGTPVSREALAELTGQGAGSERSVDVQVARLRKKLAHAPTAIQTVRGAGYVLQGHRL